MNEAYPYLHFMMGVVLVVYFSIALWDRFRE